MKTVSKLGIVWNLVNLIKDVFQKPMLILYLTVNIKCFSHKMGRVKDVHSLPLLKVVLLVVGSTIR